MKIHVERAIHRHPLDYLQRVVQLYPAVRAAVLSSKPGSMDVEIVCVETDDPVPSITEFVARDMVRDREFVAVMCIPTGIGCEIGGHAGDAGAAARLIAEVVDTLVLHPNVVNACDINEMASNSLYVEGAALTQFMMGTIGLARSRVNVIGLYLEEHPDEEIRAWTRNSVNAARRCYGAEIEIFEGPPLGMKSSIGSDDLPVVSVGDVGYLDGLMTSRTDIAAWAVASRVEIDPELIAEYFAGHVPVNPWGFVEAVLTHSLGLKHGLPIAHAPMVSSREELEIEVGVVDPRIAAETVSTTYINCVLKGLMRAPMLVDVDSPCCDLSVVDVDALVIPEGVFGLPVWAARRQGIPVIEVLENESIVDNDLTVLDWGYGLHFQVNTYLEAAGVLAALRAGIDPMTTRRLRR